MKKMLSLFFLLSMLVAKAQLPDHTYKSNIHSVKLYKAGDIYSYPVMTLNGNDQLQIVCYLSLSYCKRIYRQTNGHQTHLLLHS